MPTHLPNPHSSEQLPAPYKHSIVLTDNQTALIHSLDVQSPRFFDDVDAIANDVLLPDQFDAQFPAVYVAEQQSISEEIKGLEQQRGEKLGIKSEWMILFSAGLDYVRSLSSKVVDIRAGGLIPETLMDAFNERVSWMLAVRFRASLPSDTSHIIKHAHHLASTQVDAMGSRDELLSYDIVNFGSKLLGAVTMVDSINALGDTRSEAKLAPNLAMANQGLIEATKVLASYGLKPALVQSIAGGRIKDWMVQDFSKDIETAKEVLGLSVPKRYIAGQRVLALFNGTTTRFNEVGPAYTVRQDGKILANFTGMMKGKANQTYADLSIGLRSDGVLISDLGTDITPLINLMGRQVEHEVLRAELLTLYSDLVLPAYIIDREGNPRDPSSSASLLDSSKKLRAILNLALARTKLIGTEEVKAALIKESRRKPREHPVEEFVRDLPKGHRASPESQERYRLFKEQKGIYGAVLPPGKTFVGKHTRGTTPEGVQPIEGHRASRTIAGGAVVVLSANDDSKKPVFDSSIFGK